MIGRRRVLQKGFKLFDVFVMVACFAFASWASYLRGSETDSFSEFLSIRIKIINFILFAGLVLLWHVILAAFHFYHSKRLSGRWNELFGILQAVTLGALIIYAVARVLNLTLITPAFLAIFWLTDLALMVQSRLVLRWGLAWMRRRGRNIRFMIIVGTGRRAVDFARKIDSRPELGYRILGFADSNWMGLPEFEKNGYRIVTDIDGFAAYIRENVVDEVIIALPLKSEYKTASRVAKLCEEQGIIVRSLSDLFDLRTSKVTAGTIEGLPLVSNYSSPMHGWQVEVKRLIDVLGSAIVLVIMLPVFIIVSLAIKLSSAGPVFFVQERVGLGKRRFRVYKFRTMVNGAEKKQAELEALNEQTGAVFKIKNDPRITAVGRILRKLSIDELPQLINVLVGDMSLVGPRPLPIRDYSGFNEDWHRRRFSVRPGITCLWQANGRSDVSFERWMELDMEYIDRWSLWLDFMILAKTVPSVLRGSGAA